MPVKDQAPSARNSIRALRSIGYSFETSIADLIDNSISAGSSQINIVARVDNKLGPIVSIIDDGRGFTREDLENAATIYSANPDEVRDEDDLGKFGQGLKTASFAFAKRLSVFTKTSKTISSVHLDLDIWSESDRFRNYYDEYPPGADLGGLETQIHDLLDNYLSGSAVVWTKCDKPPIASGDPESQTRTLLLLLTKLDDWLGLTFHRFLESGKISIFINGTEVKPWSPVKYDGKDLQAVEVESFAFANGHQNLKTYLLPKIEQAQFDANSALNGLFGLSAHQGIYVYRKDRLIRFGDWLGIEKVDPNFRLARATLDVREELDEDLNLDIAKSDIQLPGYLKAALKPSVKHVTSESNKALIRRRPQVKKTAGQKQRLLQKVWLVDGSYQNIFKINQKHPIIKEAIDNYGKDFLNVINLLSMAFPGREIIDFANANQATATPKLQELSAQGLLPLAEDFLSQLLSSHNYSRQDAIEVLLSMDPFAKHKPILERMLND
jgi:hypothetical protein